ncbi:MAG: hypothetical protein PUI99_07545 [Clostridiales bacterium]|nr:hypothetical protein [Clostridiales bacterium]
MIVRKFSPFNLGRSIICLGKQGEVNALRVEFDVSAWMAMYPDATVKLMHFAPDRPQDNPVIPTLGVEGTLRVWIVGEEDTAGAGNGVIELLLIDERTGSTIKSATGYTTVLRSPSAGIEAQEPEPGYVRYDVDQSALLTDTQKAFARTNIDAIKDEKDPTVPDWAKQPRKPTYTASEVGALPSSYTPPVTSVNGMTGAVALSAQDVGARPDTWTPSASEVGADAAGTASGAVAAHNVSGAAHADLRALIDGLTSRMNALADSDDTTLDQLSEIVAYIKSNRTLIDAVTTGKVSVSDIVDNLTTNASGKVLSAAQGVALKAMIDGIVIPTALPNPEPITINGQRYDGSESVTVTTVEIDDTLTQSGKAADAKVVGDKLSELNEANDYLKNDLVGLSEKLGITTNIEDVTGSVIEGKAIDVRSGIVRTEFPYCVCTDFIDVTDRNAKYYYSGVIYYFLGIAGYDENGKYICAILDADSSVRDEYVDYELTIPENVKKIRATSYSSSTNFKANVIVVKVASSNGIIDDIEELKGDVADIKNGKSMHYVYVSQNGSDTIGDGTKENPFATIYHANETIIDASAEKQYTIIVGNGTYTDLQTKYSGTYSGKYEGVICKDYVYYESENIDRPDLTIIEWDGAVGFSGTVTWDMVVDKAPFHLVTGKSYIKGFKFVCKNLRYPIHIECAGKKSIGFEWLIENCIFDWVGRPDVPGSTKSAPVFGMGTSFFERGIIRNCKVLNTIGDSYIGGLQTHDNPWNKNNGFTEKVLRIGCRILCENVDFGNNIIEVRTMIDSTEYDIPNVIELKNCHGISILRHSFLNGMTVQVWNAITAACSIANNQMGN